MEIGADEALQIRLSVEDVLRQHSRMRKNLIPILQDVQGKLGYLPQPAMQQIAEALKIPPVDIYGVGTFYNQFRLNPPGKHQIKVCLGTIPTASPGPATGPPGGACSVRP